MKAFKKSLSFFLALLMIFTVTQCVMPVFAEENNSCENIADSEDAITDAVTIIKEDESMRTEYSKTYIMSDGSFKTDFYAHQIHTRNNDGTFSEINSGNNSVGPRKSKGYELPTLNVNGTFVSCNNQNVNYEDENYISLGEGYIGLIETMSLFSTYYGNYHISSAILKLPVESLNDDDINGAVVYAHNIIQDFDLETVTYITKPAYSNEKTDYAIVENNSVSLDITKQMNKESYGIALISDAAVGILKSSTSEVFSITYVITSGIDENYEYQSYDLGSAGSAYINKQSGNLVLARDDISTGYGKYGYDLTSTYNSLNTVENSELWQLNSSCHFESYAMFIDENGTCKYFNTENNTNENNCRNIIDENEYGFERIVATDFKTYSWQILVWTLQIRVPIAFDVYAENETIKYHFNKTGLENIQKLKQADDGSEYWENILYWNNIDENTKDLIDGDDNRIQISQTSTSVTRTQIDENNNIGETEILSLDECGNITSVTKNEETVVTYTYDNYNRITSVTNDEGYKLVFSYAPVTNDNGADFRIVSVQEYINTTPGIKIEYSRDADICTEHTAGADGMFNNDDDTYTTYTFDNNCRVICTQTYTQKEKLLSTSYSYKGEYVEEASISGSISDNLIKNHNIESLSNWTSRRIDDENSTFSVSYDTNEQYVGNGSLKITASDFTETGAVGVYQAFDIDNSGLFETGEDIRYVVSGYIKTNGITRDNNTSNTKNYGAGIMVRLGFNDNTSTKTYTETIKNTNGEWERVFASVKVPSNCKRLTVYLLVRNGIGTAYFDAIQLEKGKVPGEYNMVENNSFVDSSNWTRKNLDSSDGVLNRKFVINGNINSHKYIRQDIPITSNDYNSKYIVSAIAQGCSAPYGKSAFGVKARTVYRDGTISDDRYSSYFCTYNSEQQYVQFAFNVLPSENNSNPIAIRIYLVYYENINQAEFENISLIKSNNVYSNSKSAEENTGIYTYNDDGSISTYTDNDGNITTYTYNNDILVKEETKNSLNVTTELIIYDTDGNILSETNDEGYKTIYSYQTSSTDEKYLSKTEIKNSAEVTIEYTEYSEDGYVTSELNNGKVTSYEYDSAGNIITAVTNGVYTYYTYDSNGNLLSETTNGEVKSYTYNSNNELTSKTENGKTISYSYTDDNISSVSRNGTTYLYNYNVWGNKQNVKANGQTLESYTYKSNNGPLSQITYGNGDTDKYDYNAYGQVRQIKRNNTVAYQLNYDSKGTLIYDRDKVGNFRTYYKYDDNGFNIGEHVVSTVNSNDYANDVYDFKLKYDEGGNLTKNTVSSAYNSVTNNYTYAENDDETRQVTSQFTSARSVNSVYNADGNISSRTITTGTPFVQSYTYNDDGMVIGENRGSEDCSYSYSYDNSGRITEIKVNNAVRQSYIYDSEGQLIRENNLDANKTIVYNYDDYGNIESKIEYAYTTSDVGTATNTVTYTYDNGWKDLLTSFNGEDISYDSIGNPTTYRGATCTYFGRQLQTYKICDNLSVSYKYDSNGLRTSKTVNGIQHDYYYVDDVLMYEKAGNDYELFYRYDADGKLAMISYYRFAENESGQFNVVTNTQGDVVKILGGSGYVRAEYAYDAFGNVTIVTDNPYNEFSIASVNSIRYRGYVYDNETGLYYLQSRYYDPETGRFINCDDPDYIGTNDTFTGWNGFAYCEGDPVNCVDPSGYLLYSVVKSLYSSPIGLLGLGFYNPNASSLLGFFSEPWSTKQYCAQKLLGYCDTYDKMAWTMGCFIHCAKSEFYYKGKWWRIELWMGRYGVSVGGEIGIYNSTSNNKPKWYKCSNDWFCMSFSLSEYINSNLTNRLFTIATNGKNRNVTHWWLTGFKYNIDLKRHPPYSKSLKMKANISFNDTQMAALFVNSLKSFGWTNTKITASFNGGVATIYWSSYNSSINKTFREY